MIESASIGVIVAALLAKALHRAEDGVIDSGVEVARKAIGSLRERFSDGRDIETVQALEALVEAPDSARREKTLANLLDERAERSPQLLNELKIIAEKAKIAGVTIESIEQVADGANIAQVAGNVNSEIKVNQGAPLRLRE